MNVRWYSQNFHLMPLSVQCLATNVAPGATPGVTSPLWSINTLLPHRIAHIAQVAISHAHFTGCREPGLGALSQVHWLSLCVLAWMRCADFDFGSRGVPLHTDSGAGGVKTGEDESGVALPYLGPSSDSVVLCVRRITMKRNCLSQEQIAPVRVISGGKSRALPLRFAQCELAPLAAQCERAPL
eukprot:99049-Pleurochrysis_carterae.AAC.1